MPFRSFTSNSRRSLALGAALVLAVQAVFWRLQLPSPTCFGLDELGQRYAQVERFLDDGPIDGVVIGHSYMQNGVDPAVLSERTGMRWFSFAIGGTDLEMQTTLLRDFVLPRLRPKVVLMHLGPEDLQDHQLNRSIGILRSDGFAVQRLPLGARLVSWMKDLLPYQKRALLQWVETIVQPEDPRYRPDGFMDVELVYNPTMKRQRGGVETDPPSPEYAARTAIWRFPLEDVLKPVFVPRRNDRTPEGVAAAKATVVEAFERAREDGVRLVGVVTPITRWSYYPGLPYARDLVGAEFAAFAAWMDPLIERYGIEHANWGYYPPISDLDRLYYNRKHLNAWGAQVFSDLVARTLLLHELPLPPEHAGLVSPAQLAIVRELEGARHEAAAPDEGEDEGF